MSIDRSLKIGSRLDRHRNVLTRAERIAKLSEAEKWTEEDGVLGLPKVEHRNIKLGKKAKKKGKEEEAGS